jgi:hypothetical protein
MLMQFKAVILREVISTSYNWVVLYMNDDKIWEGDIWDSNAFEAIIRSVGIKGKFEIYLFTDENEIDGSTPDKFSEIKGIKPLGSD